MKRCTSDSECADFEYCNLEFNVCLAKGDAEIDTEEAETELDSVEDSELELDVEDDKPETCAYCSAEECCDGVCVNLKNDARNCGVCGNPCGEREVCLGGACTCPAGTETCGEEKCIDLLSNKEHCGNCETRCDYNCYQAVCSCGQGYCVPPQECCENPLGKDTDPTNDDFICFNLQEDPYNCGGCGVECGEGEVCFEGKCTCGDQPGAEGPFCTQPNTYCCADAAGDGGVLGSCLNEGEPCLCGGTERCEGGTYCCNVADQDQCVESTTEHCGPGCRMCPDPNMVCEYDLCRCPAELPNNCDGVCVNVKDDNDNCGACGTTCTDGALCCERTCLSPEELQSNRHHCGSCYNGCSSSQDCCGGACVDVLADSNNCGACGNVCLPTQTCSNGQCLCPENLVDCGNACVNLSDDEAHCGSCGTPCAGNQMCCSGQCKTLGTDQACQNCTPCAPGSKCCGGVCVDTRNSVMHCGGCNTPCQAGWACCDGVCRQGCGVCTDCVSPLVCCADEDCADLQTSASHCGGCGQACPQDHICCGATCHNGNQSLEHCGACNVPCVGTAPVCCSGSCSPDLLSDPNHCGACGVSCGSGEDCCPDGGGSAACYNLSSDTNNCGACGVSCGNGQSCCPGGACLNLSSDNNNCGSCGRRCGGDEKCENGDCKGEGCQLFSGRAQMPLWFLLLALGFWRLDARHSRRRRKA
ncbi:MAG: hypothetical protein RBU37_00285 [Myxococcota bacterium]|nr:hypothetical protein [Myxococcota bacterium]